MMKLIKQTNKGEIKIYEHEIFRRVAICKMVLGRSLCEKYAKKNGAVIPNIAMFNMVKCELPTIKGIESIKWSEFKNKI